MDYPFLYDQNSTGLLSLPKSEATGNYQFRVTRELPQKVGIFKHKYGKKTKRKKKKKKRKKKKERKRKKTIFCYYDTKGLHF